MTSFERYEALKQSGKLGDISDVKDASITKTIDDNIDYAGNSLIDFAKTSPTIQGIGNAYTNASTSISDFMFPTTTTGLRRNKEKNDQEALKEAEIESSKIQSKAKSIDNVDGTKLGRASLAIQDIMGDYSPTLGKAISTVGKAISNGGNEDIGKSLIDFGNSTTNYWDNVRIDARGQLKKWKDENPTKIDVIGGTVKTAPYIASAVVMGGSNAPTLTGRILGNAGRGVLSDAPVAAL
ncbi:MAG: hypothetical protein PHI79_07060, partial [Sulfurovaceae bacterium]|nr:hypothetical protein [Sulfurovaceae bacterium]